MTSTKTPQSPSQSAPDPEPNNIMDVNRPYVWTTPHQTHRDETPAMNAVTTFPVGMTISIR